MKKAILGISIAAGAAGLMLTGREAAAKTPESVKGKTTPSGKTLGHLAERTTDALVKQDIAATRALVKDWAESGDPLTSGALDFTIESAVSGERLEEWLGDGPNAGSPLLRAFGERVLLLEGRPDKLRLWVGVWTKILPTLALALRTKADGIAPPSPERGTTDDPKPPIELVERITQVVASGDPVAMRKLADEVEKLGYKDAANDLRAAADMIEKGQAKVPEPEKPAAPPIVVPAHEAPPPSPPPTPAPAPKPAGGAGRYVKVLKGEGPFQVTQRLLGKQSGSRFKELVSENVPPKKRDSKTGGFTSLNAGELLKIPASWPVSKYDVSGPAGTPQAPSLPVVAPPPAPAEAKTRYVVVQKGEGPFQIAQRVLGASEGAARWRELVTANVPPKKKASNGGFTSLNPGERLLVPASWPSSPAIVFGEDLMTGRAAPLNPRQAAAGRVALNIYLRKIPPKVLADWQRSEGVEPTGKYGPATAYALCFRFGIVPPLPETWGANEPEARRKFASQMFAAARRDPQRGDEFSRVAKQALSGKA